MGFCDNEGFGVSKGSGQTDGESLGARVKRGLRSSLVVQTGLGSSLPGRDPNGNWRYDMFV